MFSGLPKKGDEGANLPEELKGKSIDEVYSMLSEEHEKEMERAKAELVKQPEIQQKPAPQEAPRYNYTPQYDQRSAEAEEEVDLVSDPDRFMEKQFKKRLDPLVQQTYSSMKEMNRQNFISRTGAENWDRYGSEVDAFVNALSPQVQIDPRAYQQAYQYVLSTHMDEIVEEKSVKQASEKLQRTLTRLGIDPSQLNDSDDEDGGSPEPRSLFARNPTKASTQPVKHVKQDSKPSRRLSEAEKRIAQEFDMTDDEYREYAQLNTDLISTLGGE